MKRPALIAAVVAALASTGSPAEAGRIDPPGLSANNCVTSSGVNLNELFGVPEQIINRFCDELSAGEAWRQFALWITDDGVDSVYPPGYVPSRAKPLADFLAKLTVKVVVDAGMMGEKRYTYSLAEAVRTDVTLDQLEPGAPSLPMAVTMPRVGPLNVGEHTRELIWVLSAQHCDGIGAIVEENCLPAGELPFGTRPLTVTTPEPT